MSAWAEDAGRDDECGTCGAMECCCDAIADGCKRPRARAENLDGLSMEIVDLYGGNACTTKTPTSSDGSTSTTPSRPGLRMSVGKGRPDGYELRGEPVPSVTEVLDDWHPGGVDSLCQWAHKTAVGDPVKGIAGSHWRIERDTAGDFGTAAHDWFTRYDLGEDADEIAREAEALWGPEGVHAFREYERFVRTYQPLYSHGEITLYSKRYAFGGTFDRREVSGVIGDFKGSKQARVTMVAQLGAYSQLMRENGMGWPSAGWLFHFPRSLTDSKGKPRKFIVYRFESGDLIAGRDAFLRILDAHRIAEELKRLVK